MNLAIEKQEQYALLVIDNARIDHDDSQQLQVALLDLLDDSDVQNVIIDASRVTNADESMIGPIAFANKRFKESGGVLVVASACKKLQTMIELSQLDQGVEMLPTLTEAVDFVFMHEIEKQLRNEGDL
jgi:anti-sigma B factor antagonist